MAFTQRGSAAQTSSQGRSQGHPLRSGVKRSGPTNPAARRPSYGRFHVNRQVASAFCRKVDPLWVLQITNRWVLTMLARSRPAPNQRPLNSRVFPGCGSVGHEYPPEEGAWSNGRARHERTRRPSVLGSCSGRLTVGFADLESDLIIGNLSAFNLVDTAYPRPARAKKYHTRGGVARKAARIR